MTGSVGDRKVTAAMAQRADESSPAADQSPIKRALREIRQLRLQLAQAQDRLQVPVAITGMGLRLPGGVHDADGFAELLWSARDAIAPIPPTRWSVDDLYSPDPDAPGKMTTRFGGFLDEVDRFDAEFFGISPREAASMDPQQRLMLEVAWQAIEDAGHAPGGLGGTRTGVYLGVCNNDYGRALFADRDSIDAYFSTGNAYSVVAGRLSYLLGLQGPSLAIDTACSSSLVAVHLACQALRAGECDLALAGAENLILTPEMNINFSRARMMAPDGRCKAFDAAADGYVRGEGCGVLVLRRLADALADGDRILAVVKGSAVNQDGRSGGLTAPNGPAQEAVIRQALAAAAVAPDDIGYVEAHGTGTALGDPVEVGALGAVFGDGRSSPLLIGSVKTNIGHLEAAAGIAGIAKVVLAMQHQELPPQLHFKEGNPHVDWSRLPVAVVTQATPWQPVAGRRLAGVSAFGFSGTNAHVVLEQAPPRQPAPAVADRPRQVLTVSARDEQALAEQVGRFMTRIAAEADPAAVADICHTANLGRTHFACRVAVTGSSLDELHDGLAAFAAGKATASVACSQLGKTRMPKVAFLFTGQSAQYAGMARTLYDTAPHYRRTLDECAQRLAPRLRRPMLDIMFAEAGDPSIDDAAHAQPLLFAHEYALAQLWRSWGIEPAVVAGHSLGEYAAACVAGVFPLHDALNLVAERGRLAASLPGGGGMAAVFAAPSRVGAVLERSRSSLVIAACNGPEHVVLSGPRRELDAMLGRLDADGIRCRLLKVSFAAHSPQVDAILPAFAAALQGVALREPAIPLLSNVSGAIAAAGEVAGARYWLEHLRQPVRFSQSVQALAGVGISHCIEIGPHPVLLGMAAETLPQSGIRWLPSLHRDRTDWTDLLESLQRLHVDGAEVDWQAFDRDYSRRRVALPTYPFRRRRHWMDQVGERARAAPPSVDASQRWSRLGASLQRQSERAPLALDVRSCAQTWQCLAQLTQAHAIALFNGAALFDAAGGRRDVDEVLAATGIRSIYRHLVQRWLDRLVAHGLLQSDGGRYFATAPLPAPDLAGGWAEAERRLTDNQPLLAYLRNCGTLLAPVLRGQESALETLFPGGSFDLAQALYERSATMRYINDLAAAAVESLVASSNGCRLRIMEVGAGTGGTTASLLPVLAPTATRYCYTDVSDVFLEHAARRFAGHEFVEYRRFDVDEDAAAQGFVPQGFDVIVAANAVHACRNLRLALQRLQALLAPGGILLLVESTVHMDWFDMTTGLIEGWQHFEDDLRGDNPLLAPQAWLEALCQAGFTEAQAWPSARSAAADLGQHVIVARSPGESHEAADAEPPAAVVRTPAGSAPMDGEGSEALREAIERALPGDRLELLRDYVRERVMRVLRLDAGEAPSRHARLMDLGFDSLMAVQLRNQLGAGLRLERPLGATVMFDHPTIDALAVHLLERLGGSALPGTYAGDRAVASAAPAAPAMPRPAAPALGEAAVAAMTDEQVEALLLERLDNP